MLARLGDTGNRESPGGGPKLGDPSRRPLKAPHTPQLTQSESIEFSEKLLWEIFSTRGAQNLAPLADTSDTVETAKGCGNNGYNLFGLHLSTRPVRPGPSSAKALFSPVLSVPVSIANAPCQVRGHSLGA